MCPGFGEVKAKRLREVFSQPFRVGEGRTYRQRKTGSTNAGGEGASVVAARGTALEEANLVPTKEGSNGNATEIGSGTSAGTAAPTRALDALEENFDDLTEEEQLRLAMQLSMDTEDVPSP